MKKNNLKNIIKSIVFIAAFIAVFIFLNLVFVKNDKSTDTVYEIYGMEKNSLDILVLGSSHSFNSFVPPIINDELELDSYNLSTGYNYIDQGYFLLKDALKKQEPKIVILEMYSIRDNYDYWNHHHVVDRACHRAFDGMKLSKNKIDAINYNIKDKTQRLPFIFPIVEYHSKWKNDNIDELFLEEIQDIRHGGYFGYFIHALDPLYSDELMFPVEGEYSPVRITPVTESTPLDPDILQMLDNITKLCQGNDIKLIYYVSPFIEQEDVDYPTLKKQINSLYEYIAENNIDLIDFNELSVELNLDDTCLTDEGHVTMEGAYIISHYLADYIEDNYSDIIDNCTWDTTEESAVLYKAYLSHYDEYLELKPELVENP